MSRPISHSILGALILSTITTGAVLMGACSDNNNNNPTPKTEAGTTETDSGNDGGGLLPGTVIENGVSIMGRADTTLVEPDSKTGSGVVMSWPGVQIRVKFKGTEVRGSFNERVSPSLENLNLDTVSEFVVIVDDKVEKTIQLKDGTNTDVVLWQGDDAEHTLSLVRKTESRFGTTTFNGFTFPNNGQVLPIERPTRKILFFGDSITAAYGSDKVGPYDSTTTTPPGTCPPDRFANPDAGAPTLAQLKSDTAAFISAENAANSFAMNAGKTLKADVQLVALSGSGISRSRNAETPKLGDIYDRLNAENASPKFDPAKWPADAVVINIGTNDFVDNGVPSDPGAVYQAKLEEFATKIRQEHPNAWIFLMVGPMVPFPESDKLKAYADTTLTNRDAAGDKKVKVVKVTQNTMKVGCEFHPSADSHKAMSDSIAAEIKASIGWK